MKFKETEKMLDSVRESKATGSTASMRNSIEVLGRTGGVKGALPAVRTGVESRN